MVTNFKLIWVLFSFIEVYFPIWKCVHLWLSLFDSTNIYWTDRTLNYLTTQNYPTTLLIQKLPTHRHIIWHIVLILLITSHLLILSLIILMFLSHELLLLWFTFFWWKKTVFLSTCVPYCVQYLHMNFCILSPYSYL